MQWQWRTSRFYLVATLFAVALLFFTATRTVFLVLSYTETELSLLSLTKIYATGLLFDIAFFSYACIPLTLYLWLVPDRFWQSFANRGLIHLLIFVAFYALCFIAVAEYLFWEEFSVRFNFISVDYLIYRREVTENINESYPMPFLLSAMFALSSLFYWVCRSYVVRTLNTQETFSHRTKLACSLLVIPLIALIGCDQQTREISLNTYQNELASNGPYQFFAAFRHNELDYDQFYCQIPSEEASNMLRHEVTEPHTQFLDDDPFSFSIKRQINHPGPEKRLNVMLIMVESLSARFLEYFHNDRHVTPYLDALIDESLFFTNFYATGTRTTRGLEAVTLSIPPTPGRSIVKRLGREGNMWSLGNVLKEQGYDVSFLYGGHGYFDNMNAFFSGNGYKVTDLSNVPKEEIGFQNAWGMADEYLYDAAIKSADEAHSKGNPFFFHLMTTSNHRPYTYPEDRIDIPSGTGRSGAVKYTDYAVHHLLEQARKKPWFDDTLFVILADHCSGVAGKRALPAENYHIPLWIYCPKHIAPKKINVCSSQIDVAPTILAMLNTSYVSSFFGKDILTMSQDEGRSFIGNYQHLGLLTDTDNRLAVLSPQKRAAIHSEAGTENVRVELSDPTDPLMQRNISFYQGASYIYQNKLNAWESQSR